jgi:hypothetical protein
VGKKNRKRSEDVEDSWLWMVEVEVKEKFLIAGCSHSTLGWTLGSGLLPASQGIDRSRNT